MDAVEFEPTRSLRVLVLHMKTWKFYFLCMDHTWYNSSTGVGECIIAPTNNRKAWLLIRCRILHYTAQQYLAVTHMMCITAVEKGFSAYIC